LEAESEREDNFPLFNYAAFELHQHRLEAKRYKLMEFGGLWSYPTLYGRMSEDGNPGLAIVFRGDFNSQSKDILQ
jgi:hypothetical protein